ncbi:hypothetical protein AB8O55_24755 [Saccharopolyspora cebuensis]|uniref:Uncharacterized protein n=1 Tax=Saccharopolyspora cebuensis TaxID=418759 RepID=A0ABV4CPH0_9PSEU
MRFRAYIVFLRLCGASGLGVYLGAALCGSINIATGAAFSHGTEWLAGVPVLAVLGAVAGLAAAWLTRRWFVPRVPRRRLVFTLAGAASLPMAVTIGQGEADPFVVFPIMGVMVVVTVTLWVRGFRRETALARAVMYGNPRPARW